MRTDFFIIHIFVILFPCGFKVFPSKDLCINDKHKVPVSGTCELTNYWEIENL